jgi:tetratricopeptide (TPR) repeat protein
MESQSATDSGGAAGVMTARRARTEAPSAALIARTSPAATRGAVVGIGLSLIMAFQHRDMPFGHCVAATLMTAAVFAAMGVWLWIMAWPDRWSSDFLPIPHRRAVHLVATVAGAAGGAALAALMGRPRSEFGMDLILGVAAGVSASLARGVSWLNPPWGAPALVDRGLEAAAAGDGRVALSCLGRAIGLDPSYAHAYRERAALLLDLATDPVAAQWALDGAGRVTTMALADAALADLEAAIRLRPGSAEGHAIRARAHLARCPYGEPEAEGEEARRLAIADLDEAIRLGPGDASHHHLRGRLRPAGTAEELSDYDAAVRLDPASAEYLLSRGLAHRARGDLDSAIADFTEALRLRPGYLSALSERARAYREKGDDDRSEADEAAARRPKGY